MDVDGVEFVEPDELEADALDALESYEDAGSPAGTVPLESARRRRAVSDVATLTA